MAFMIGRQICPFCGQPLQPRIISVNGKDHTAGYMNCSCEGAVLERMAATQQEEEKAKKEKHEKHIWRLNRAGIPKRFRDVKTDVSEYVDAIKKGYSFVFSGGVGTGKTYLACAIASALIDDLTIQFTSVAKINAAIFDDAMSEAELFRSLAQCQLLILDDLGKEKPSEWLLALTFRIVNARYEENLPIVVTMNYTMEELKRRLEASPKDPAALSIVSRLYEMCGGAPVTLHGGDRRRRETRATRANLTP